MTSLDAIKSNICEQKAPYVTSLHFNNRKDNSFNGILPLFTSVLIIWFFILYFLEIETGKIAESAKPKKRAIFSASCIVG